MSAPAALAGGFAALRLAPDRPGRPTPWAQAWRRRWLRQVGPATALPGVNTLYLAHTPARAAQRDALLDELGAQPNRIADVLAACQAHGNAIDRQLAGGRR